MWAPLQSVVNIQKSIRVPLKSIRVFQKGPWVRRNGVRVCQKGSWARRKGTRKGMSEEFAGVSKGCKAYVRRA